MPVASCKRALRVSYGGVALLVLVALLVGVSRVYLRVHYLTDVVGGYALALGWLSAALAITRLLGERLSRNAAAPSSQRG